MGNYYTLLTGLGVTNFTAPFTHSLGIAGGSLVARPIIQQTLLTATAPLIVVSISTNTITMASGVGTLVTFNLEVQQIHSLIS